ncbi:MAG TPA: alkaline shock response membrane anchor protein AmaP [Symbiobacteriaceae bacterium]|nr:alkaline shock response membrane anchor protein AmaP [Symbiobacteriaceae bacterium]
MSIFDRVVLSIFTFSLAIISGLMVVLAIVPTWFEATSWIESVLTTTSGRFILGIVGFVFFAASVRLILTALTGQGDGRPVVHETQHGEIRISLDAVENLVKKVARGVKGVREIKAEITHAEDGGLRARLRGTISPEVSIPEVSEEIQSSVRQYVKRVVGIEMAEVAIHVENIAAEGNRRRLD